MRTCLVSFRTHLITFTAAIALIASAAASAASVGSSAGGGGSSSGASTGSSGAGSGGSAGGASSGGGGGSGHGGGGGGGAHFGGGGAGGGHYFGGGGYGSRGGYGSDVGHAVYAARGYSVVGYESAGVGRAGATPRAEHGARDPLALGPPRGSAAAATRVMDRFQPHPRGPHHPLHRPGHHPVEVLNRCRNAARCANEMPAPLCIPASNLMEQSASPDYDYWQYGCTTAVKVRLKVEPIKAAPID